jgi:hypothetical protein
MSSEQIEKILATYPPVEGKSGYVWFNKNSIVKLKTLREAYEEEFKEGPHEKEQQ